jgi:hypothetical protein
MSPPAIPFMAAFTIETADLQSAINTLQKNDVSFVEKEGSVIVDSLEAGGCCHF